MKAPSQLCSCSVAWCDDAATVTGTLRWTPGEDDLRLERDDGSEPVPLWNVEDVLHLVPAGETVHLDFGDVRIALRDDGAARVHASVAAVVAGERREARSPRGAEAALKELGEGPDRACPKACFWCAWSDYAPGAGFVDRGHFACFVADAAAYARIATSDVWRKRRVGPWLLTGRRWVDEFGTCERWQRRPEGHGYRG